MKNPSIDVFNPTQRNKNTSCTLEEETNEGLPNEEKNLKNVKNLLHSPLKIIS